LQLKKQQLQMEILHQVSILQEKRHSERHHLKSIEAWAGVLADKSFDIKLYLKPQQIITDIRNIAGTDIPVFIKAQFPETEYDLFLTPLWIDAAIEGLRALVVLREDISVIEKGIVILRGELRITTQRVNLFEKVKIPEAEESIRLIKIYIGDQMANAVGRSKIAKRKIEELTLQEVAV
jgi:V/A-type H+-transporting ATPase subunit D